MLFLSVYEVISQQNKQLRGINRKKLRERNYLALARIEQTAALVTRDEPQGSLFSLMVGTGGSMG